MRTRDIASRSASGSTRAEDLPPSSNVTGRNSSPQAAAILRPTGSDRRDAWLLSRFLVPRTSGRHSSVVPITNTTSIWPAHDPFRQDAFAALIFRPQEAGSVALRGMDALCIKGFERNAIQYPDCRLALRTSTKNSRQTPKFHRDVGAAQPRRTLSSDETVEGKSTRLRHRRATRPGDAHALRWPSPRC